MEILFVPQEGIPLYETLRESETSRGVLEFYRPENLGFAVRIRTSSLGAALSLVSELRWYVRRYMDEVLFMIRDRVYATRALAWELYDRKLELKDPWECRYLYVFRGRERPLVIPLKEGEGPESYPEQTRGAEALLEVWDIPAGAGESEGPGGSGSGEHRTV